MQETSENAGRRDRPLYRKGPSWFERRTARIVGDRWTALQARQVFILPTRAGLSFAALLLVLLLGAVNYDNNLIFALTFLLTGLGFIAMLHTYRNLVHLECQSGAGRPGFVGDRIGFQLWLRPADGRPRQAIELRIGDTDRVRLDVSAHATAIWLTRLGRRRGRLTLGMVTVATRFPLGLFRAWSYLDVRQAEPVYPAPAPSGNPPPATVGTRPDDGGGPAAGGDDFGGLRDYRPGDSLRHIDWKTWARGRGLLTKQFSGAASAEPWLDFAAAREPDAEARLARLCRWIIEAERAQQRYGLRLPGVQVDPGRGPAHRDRCLLTLADFGLVQ